ncbi:unnamed protein product [Leuciscus chuanchicus]
MVAQHMTFKGIILAQGFSNQALEGHCPAQFSSNPDQTHLAKECSLDSDDEKKKKKKEKRKKKKDKDSSSSSSSDSDDDMKKKKKKKKALTAMEGDDIKKSLEFMTEEISAVKLQQKSILDLVEEVKALRIQNAEKDRRLVYLESRVADLEQHTRINDVVITGLRIKPRSYARAVTPDNVGEPREQDVSSVEQQVVTFLQSKGIEMVSDNIEACHLLPRRNDSDKPAIIMRLNNPKHKTALLKQGRKLKGSNVYIND